MLHTLDRRFIFCINSSPGNPRISLFHFNLAGIHDILLCKRTFDISQSRHRSLARTHRFQYFIGNHNPYIALIVKQISTFHQQCIHRICRSYRGIPLLRLLLFQQPEFHFFHRFAVSADQFQSFHNVYMSLHPHSSPRIRILVESEEHPLFVRLCQMFFQRSNKFLRFFLLSGFIEHDSSNRLRIH